jgi:RNA recognition motif-containing protein
MLFWCCLWLLMLKQGWGTVRFTSKEAAAAAIEQFHGSQLEGRTLTVFLDKKA